MKTKLDQIKSLCPVCFKKVDAFLFEENAKVYMEKSCSEHGYFKALYWDNAEHYRWCNLFEKPRKRRGFQTSLDNGCPYDCGLCPDHQQHTCLAIIDVTEKCNLSCNYCFASSENTGETVSLEEIRTMFQTLRKSEGEPRPVQLSGGEPTLREDLHEIVQIGKDEGFQHIEINTNGIKLAKDKELLERLKKAGISCLYLQFDGLTSDVYLKIRGADLLGIKMKVVEKCRKLGIPVILVPTIIKGINDHQIGSIVQFAIKNVEVVRGINFQPLAKFGRFANSEYLSLAGIAERIERQTSSIGTYDFYPIPCPDVHCSLATMLISNTRSDLVCVTRLIDMKTYLEDVHDKIRGATFMDMLVDPSKGQDMAEEIICSCGIKLSGAIQKVLEKSLTITMMGFMDANTINLDRLSKCCIHQVNDDNLIPFCAYNLTNTQGKYLYREQTVYETVHKN